MIQRRSDQEPAGLESLSHSCPFLGPVGGELNWAAAHASSPPVLASKRASCDLSTLSRRMATKEHKPMGPEQRKAIRFTDSLVEVATSARAAARKSNEAASVGGLCAATGKNIACFRQIFYPAVLAGF
jgi:hypothetical protein